MALPELYAAVGGDYPNVLERLGDEQTIQYFVLRYLSDPSYEELQRWLREKDMKQAFYAAHTLKGVTQSLGFGRLGRCASTLCEKLRKGTVPSDDLLQQLETEYRGVIAAIQEWQNER